MKTETNKIPGVSLVLPMYNEKDYLVKTVQTAGSILGGMTDNYEIIIVDDASTDGSGTMADSLACLNNRIKVIHHGRNRKLGGALKTGFYKAVKDIIVYTDIDLPFDLSRLKDLILLVNEFDIIKGYRSGKRESLLRSFYSKAYNLLINFVFHVKFRDINFSLKIFKRSALNELELKSEGSFIDAEFMVKAANLGYSIKEVELEYTPRTYGISRLSSPGVIFKIIYEMLKLFPEVRGYSRKGLGYRKLRRLYRNSTLWIRFYNFIRLLTCPFYKIAEALPVGCGKVIDMGCGTGIFLNLVRITRGGCGNLESVGFDTDERKIAAARQSLAIGGYPAAEFKTEDITSNTCDFRGAKCVIMTDVLCYFDGAEKNRLLQKCFRELDAGGTVIIKDINKGATLKFFWTLIQETIAIRMLRLGRYRGFYFGDRNEYLDILEKNGFSAEAFDLSRGYIYPHILYVAKKKDSFC